MSCGGETMVDDPILHRALTAWMEGSDGGRLDLPSGHLDEAVLYRLSQPGGLDAAAEAELDHLSLCPVCLAAWNEWLDTEEIIDGDGDERVEPTCSVGFLKAAAASLYQGPLSLVSSCGRFELSVYPELREHGRGLVTLEVLGADEVHERGFCVVRDGVGTVILQGSIEDGRLAGRIDDLSLLDLKTWTVLVSNR